MTPETLTRAVRLATFQTQPMRYVHADHITGLDDTIRAEDLGLIAAHPAFERHLNHAVFKALSLADTGLKRADLDAFETDETARNLCDLVTLTTDRFEHFLTLVAAVRLHGAILKCVLKSDRQKMQAVLGDAAYTLAVREAPLVYPAMNVDPGHPRLVEKIGHADALREYGAAFVRRFVQAEQPGLIRMLDLRLPGTPREDPQAPSVAETATFRRFLRERLPR